MLRHHNLRQSDVIIENSLETLGTEEFMSKNRSNK
jgi:hypothetical protein